MNFSLLNAKKKHFNEHMNTCQVDSHEPVNRSIKWLWWVAIKGITCKTTKVRTPEKFAVIILKAEQFSFMTE